MAKKIIGECDPDLTQCEECGLWYTDNHVECPSCGCPIDS